MNIPVLDEVISAIRGIMNMPMHDDFDFINETFRVKGLIRRLVQTIEYVGEESLRKVYDVLAVSCAVDDDMFRAIFDEVNKIGLDVVTEGIVNTNNIKLQSSGILFLSTIMNGTISMRNTLLGDLDGFFGRTTVSILIYHSYHRS